MTDQLIPEVDRRLDLHGLIAGVWGDLLGVPAVRDTDTFFGLGGHSLKALHMLDLVEDSCGAELGGMREISEHPTLAEFVTFVAGRLATGPG